MKADTDKSDFYADRIKFLLKWSACRWLPVTSRRPSRPPRRVLLMPPDPWSFAGSRGDEAMILAVLDRLRELFGQVDVTVPVASEEAAAAAGRLGLSPLACWDSGFMHSVMAVLQSAPDAAIFVGADCMDGFYSHRTSVRIIAMADVLARRNVAVMFTGFSFNDKPHPEVVRALRRLSGRVVIQLRDPVSFERLSRVFHGATRLVADAAFMLSADTTSEQVRSVSDWVIGRRMTSNPVVAFNVHPMLFSGKSYQVPSSATLQSLTSAATHALTRLMDERNVSIVLLSHDYRARDGDDQCLARIFESLQRRFSDRILYPSEQMSARQLKGIAGCMDGVVTGRMHLAIAGLGMGVPVLPMTYQGKFEGLLQHFEYPREMRISGDDVVNEQVLHSALVRFVGAIPALRMQVRSQLPRVTELSRRGIDDVFQGWRAH